MRSITLTAVAKGDKATYIIDIDGEQTAKEVTRVFEDSSVLLKKRTLEILIKGLLAVRDIVEHEDELTIYLENNHLVKWLIEEKEYDGYEKISTVLNLIDNLDCRVFIKSKNLRNIKTKLADTETEKEEVMDFARILMDE